MNKIIADFFNNSNDANMFKRLPVKIAGASNVYIIKMNYNYTNQNKYSYLNGCIFKCDADKPTEDDIEIMVNVLPGINYSTKCEEGYEKQFKYYDGTWFRLYWNKYFESWKIATSQLINGEIASWNNVPIGEIFEEYVETINKDNLDKETTYFFIFSHPNITFDPSVTNEHTQFICAVNNGEIIDTDVFQTNDEEIDDKCNVVQISQDGVNMVIQNEMYQEVKNHFRTDINTIFLNFFAKPDENMHVMKMFFDMSPRFVDSYNRFINNPLLNGLVSTITDFTTKNMLRYFNNMTTHIIRLDKPIFKIWCNMLMRVDANYSWNHSLNPFENLKNMNRQVVALLTNKVFVREMLCNLPIKDILDVIM